MRTDDLQSLRDGRIGASPVGGAPISWGACEVPGWGPMPDADAVLSEMATLGLLGTELGAPGFLPDAPDPLRAALVRHGLRLVGSFTALVLHEPDAGPALTAAGAVLDLLTATGGEVLIGAAVQDPAWSPPQRLDDAGWRRLADNAGRVAALAAERGVGFALHPHVGTLLFEAEDIARAVAETDVAWCLDTGHLTIGGVDPARFARDHGPRVGHVHLKDVDAAIAARVRSGELSLLDATRAGLFAPLGAGDAPITETLSELDRHGYAGWLVLEQDTTLGADRDAPVHDAEASIRFLIENRTQEEITG